MNLEDKKFEYYFKNLKRTIDLSNKLMTDSLVTISRNVFYFSPNELSDAKRRNKNISKKDKIVEDEFYDLYSYYEGTLFDPNIHNWDSHISREEITPLRFRPDNYLKNLNFGIIPFPTYKIDIKTRKLIDRKLHIEGNPKTILLKLENELNFIPVVPWRYLYKSLPLEADLNWPTKRTKSSSLYFFYKEFLKVSVRISKLEMFGQSVLHPDSFHYDERNKFEKYLKIIISSKSYNKFLNNYEAEFDTEEIIKKEEEVIDDKIDEDGWKTL